MVNALFQQAEIPVFTRVEDKKRPCREAFSKLLQGLFVYVGGLAIFALIRINGSAP
jgi:hypothetical protein